MILNKKEIINNLCIYSIVIYYWEIIDKEEFMQKLKL
jgi:hypothetical protein